MILPHVILLVLRELRALLGHGDVRNLAARVSYATNKPRTRSKHEEAGTRSFP